MIQDLRQRLRLCFSDVRAQFVVGRVRGRPPGRPLGLAKGFGWAKSRSRGPAAAAARRVKTRRVVLRYVASQCPRLIPPERGPVGFIGFSLHPVRDTTAGPLRTLSPATDPRQPHKIDLNQRQPTQSLFPQSTAVIRNNSKSFQRICCISPTRPKPPNSLLNSKSLNSKRTQSHNRTPAATTEPRHAADAGNPGRHE